MLGEALKKDFPILSLQKNGYPLIYFDSASTSQKPQQVLDALVHFYSTSNANSARGVYDLGERATLLYEQARATVAHFIGAHVQEIIFTSGATQGINFVATAWAYNNLVAGDQVVITQLEHHANMVPWQQLIEKIGIVLRYIPVAFDGTLCYTSLADVINKKTKLVAITHTSNAIGTHVDVAMIVDHARAVGARVLLDAAQSVAHQSLDVCALDVDFLVFSGHKIMGPTGIGVLFVKRELHHQVAPYQYGGGMIFDADFYTARFLQPPHIFEAGTPPIAQAVGLAAALDYYKAAIDFNALQKHEAFLCARLIDGLSLVPGITVLGPVQQLREIGHLVSFVSDRFHAHDIAAYLNQFNICVRAGNHCAQPLAKKMGIAASVRVSFACYNTADEVDFFLEKLKDLMYSASF